VYVQLINEEIVETKNLLMQETLRRGERAQTQKNADQIFHAVANRNR